MVTFRLALMYGVIALVLLVAIPHDRLILTPVKQLATPHLYDLIWWETSHFLDKWRLQIWIAMPWTHYHGSPQAVASDYFNLGEQLRQINADLQKAIATSHNQRSESFSDLQRQAVELEHRRKRMQGHVEEILESTIASIVTMEEIPVSIGPIKFPPVDFTFATQPHLLIVSPRNRIQRMEDVLLDSDISLTQIEQIEASILREQDLSALVENIGGIATYPSMVSPTQPLHDTLITASHEWLHHYFFFHPLGQHFGDSSDMSTLNETAATLAGQEIGNLAYELLAGRMIDKSVPLQKHGGPTGDEFIFQLEMHETRLRTDELLAQERIEDAEAYMEERRRLFVEHGFFIRKLNQAYFAFHGTYATSPSSVSPIATQLKELRRQTPSLGHFVRLVASVSNYDQFQAILAEHTDLA